MKTIYQTKLLYPEILWERPVHYYKSKAGKILIIAGSRGLTKKALMTCEAVFRSGTGLLTLAFPEELKNIMSEILPDEMTLELPQTHSGSISKKAKEIIINQIKTVDLVIIGPDLSTNSETVHLIWEILPEIKKATIIDDDGLKALAYGIDAIKSKIGEEEVKKYFKNLKTKLILTPNSGDATKIANAIGIKNRSKSSNSFEQEIKTSELISQMLDAVVVLKSRDIAIINPELDTQIINKTNTKTSNLDESHEVLTGLIGSFVAQNPKKTEKAIATAVYIYTLAIRLAKDEINQRSLNTTDIIRFIPKAIKEAESENI
jgi:ADP-dependent NAD(P)H-hydrate dehydratase / NAD(P)H-hydrate epimerase